MLVATPILVGRSPGGGLVRLCEGDLGGRKAHLGVQLLVPPQHQVQSQVGGGKPGDVFLPQFLQVN